MVEAMTSAWRRVVGGEPPANAVRLLVAHWALETGWGRSMVCFNVGNAKAMRTDASYDYCYFTTWEVLTVRDAEAYVRAHPTTARITKYTSNERHAHVEVRPEDPACRFRAYASLEDGCVEHLQMLRGIFARSWSALCSGDPAAFSRALKAQKYYTADEGEYTKLVVANFAALAPKPPPPPTLFQATVTAPSGLNLRSSAGGSVVASAIHGARVAVVGVSEDGKWLEIVNGPHRGFASAEWLQADAKEEPSQPLLIDKLLLSSAAYDEVIGGPARERIAEG